MRRPRGCRAEDFVRKEENGCWIWLGATDTRGYGIGLNEGQIHRFLYEKYVGPIPEGFVLHHKCEVKRCVNYEHVVPLPKTEHLKLHNPKKEEKIIRARLGAL